MKYIITLIASMFLFSNIAYAENMYSEADEVNAHVRHYFENVEIQTKVSNRTCQEVDIPIYKDGKSSTGEVLGGAIIGGVIGNQIGKGKGNDAATILGAILGADFANKKGNKTIVGYKRTTVCEDNPTFVTEVKKVYTHSIIRFQQNGKQYNIKFIKHDQ